MAKEGNAIGLGVWVLPNCRFSFEPKIKNLSLMRRGDGDIRMIAKF